MPSSRSRRETRTTKQEKLVAAAGSFTGLWALTWLGAGAAPVSAAVTGGLAVGSVMASSGLTLLWWKTRSMHHLLDDEEEDESLATLLTQRA